MFVVFTESESDEILQLLNYFCLPFCFGLCEIINYSKLKNSFYFSGTCQNQQSAYVSKIKVFSKTSDHYWANIDAQLDVNSNIFLELTNFDPISNFEHSVISLPNDNIWP